MSTLLSIVLQWGPHPGPHTPMGPHWGGGVGPWGASGGTAVDIAWPVLVVVALAGAVLLAASLAGSRSSEPDRAMTVLHEAYARGDLDDEDFERRASRLAGSSTADPTDSK